jgi:hypothetical protein
MGSHRDHSQASTNYQRINLPLLDFSLIIVGAGAFHFRDGFLITRYPVKYYQRTNHLRI